jgi:DNA polymerase-3 subunit gamma/tau
LADIGYLHFCLCDGKIMSYQVLARKWRPKTFQAMVGQEHVLRMLTNALDNQRLHHAYLFTGTRGVGKTSLARLLAKCLNCETGITSNPCDTCSTCVSIDSGRFLDLLEIDAASRTKVEDTRELLDNVQYAPTQGRFKIYLIDEVHMLSGHSFNALLKTLEEPPAHVKFLLATTDPKRLPVTILSRCLQFNLKRVPVVQIAKQLQHISDAEQITFEAEGLEQLAHAADGSMRDALSLLDQAIAYCGGQITSANVQQMLGNIEQDYIWRLLTALAGDDGNAMLNEIAQLSEQAPHFDQVLENLLTCLHKIAVTQVIKAPAENAMLEKFAKDLSAEAVQLYYQIALLGRRDLTLAPHPALGFEMVMLRMLAFQPKAESQPTPPSKTTISKPATVAAPTPPPVAKKIEKPAAPVKIAPVSSDNWIALLPQLGLAGMSYTLASHCALDEMTDTGIKLNLSKKHDAFLNPAARTRIEEAVQNYFKKPMSVAINIITGELDTSAKQHQQAQTTRQANAVEAIKADTQVKKILDVFGVALDEKSIKAVDTVKQ